MPQPIRSLDTPPPPSPAPPEPLALARALQRAAEARQAEDVQVLDISKISSFADYFVLCSGSNERHVQAIHEAMAEEAVKLGVRLHHVEGETESRWILLDFADVVVHIFLRELRLYYNIDRLWADAPEVRE